MPPRPPLSHFADLFYFRSSDGEVNRTRLEAKVERARTCRDFPNSSGLIRLETDQTDDQPPPPPSERQASTMRILGTYFRKGAPSAAAVPLSDQCRSSTLKFRASSAFIFDRARGEMLEKMGVGKVLVSFTAAAAACWLWR